MLIGASTDERSKLERNKISKLAKSCLLHTLGEILTKDERNNFGKAGASNADAKFAQVKNADPKEDLKLF
jgi:hypothetical protein